MQKGQIKSENWLEPVPGLYSSATKENFIDMLNREPRVLHISCHGISSSVFRNTINYEEHVRNGNCLLFEKSTGEGELVCV